MTGQGIRELRPSEVLGVPVVELWSDCVRLVHATHGEVDQAGAVRCGERNRCAADLTEAPLRLRCGCIELGVGPCEVDLSLLEHGPGDSRGPLGPSAPGEGAACGHAWAA